jgi:hypothetical protein
MGVEVTDEGTRGHELKLCRDAAFGCHRHRHAHHPRQYPGRWTRTHRHQRL